MFRISLPRAAVAPAALALFCLSTDLSHASSQKEVTSAAPGPTTAPLWIKRAPLPDDSLPGCPRYSTGIAARIVDAYGLGALGVMAEGPFVMPRWHIRAFHADSNPDRWHPLKQEELYPASGQHVLFVWPEI